MTSYFEGNLVSDCKSRTVPTARRTGNLIRHLIQKANQLRLNYFNDLTWYALKLNRTDKVILTAAFSQRIKCEDGEEISRSSTFAFDQNFLGNDTLASYRRPKLHGTHST